jgi:hypothetical protein
MKFADRPTEEGRASFRQHLGWLQAREIIVQAVPLDSFSEANLHVDEADDRPRQLSSVAFSARFGELVAAGVNRAEANAVGRASVRREDAP